MVRVITAEEIDKLLKMEDAGDKKGVSKYITDNFGILDGQEARKALSNARVAANPSTPASGLEQALGMGGIGAGAAGIATARFLELTKGSTTTYEAILSRTEVAARLRTALEGNFGVRESGEEIVVSRVDPMGIFCRIRVSIAGDKTAVVVSGMNLTKTTQGADDVLGGLMNLGKGMLQGDDVVGSVLDTIGDAVNTAKEVGSDLWTANTIADVIEKYGAERERMVADAKREAATDKAEKAAQERKEKSCSYCGAARELGKACPECGATES